jgi:serine/threonine-protein kinase HipA
MPDRLGIWLEGTRIADIERRRRNDTRLRVRYTDDALDGWPRNTPLVSCSLPLTDRPLDGVAFLKGVLPEGEALASLAARARTSVIDTFGLLERYGRDIAGALVIAADTPDETRFDVEAYEGDQLANEVAGLDQNPLGIHDDSELSLAGIQNKLLLVSAGTGWARPIHGRPSTHILKAEDRRFPGMAQAEVDCLGLARGVELTPVESSFVLLGTIPCLITERYDRKVGADGEVTRVHQEDLCQAMGVDGSGNRGRAKYQRRNGGGPGWSDAAALLNSYAADPVHELRRLTAALAFTVAIGNADAHAKNLSFLHDTSMTIQLAPLYDTVPTLLWPQLTDESALAINSRFPLPQMTVADVVAEAASWHFDRALAETTTVETLERLRIAASDIESEPLSSLITGRCDALLAEYAAAG